MKKISIVISILLVSGCSTIETAKNAKGTGSKGYFTVSKSEVWPAMQAAVVVTGGSIKQKSESECMILASYAASAWSWGEKVAVFCHESENKIEVEVVNQATLKTSVTVTNNASKILQEISKRVNR
jgi:hypothetical protein